MAEKEASVFIIDVGQSMSLQKHGRQQSDLDYSLQYVYDKITSVVATGRKTLLVGVVALRTDRTVNHMQEEDGYEHITITQAIKNMDLSDLQRLPKALTPSNIDAGDILSAVILGVDMLVQHCRHLKFTKRLYLVTNGTGPLDADDLESTAAQIKQNNIQLTVLGVDFDDAKYGFKEENKAYQKMNNEKVLQQLVDLTDGTFATMEEAIEGLTRPHIKTIKPIPSYKGQLRLGDPETYDTAITIDIERYPKIMIRKPPSAKSFVVKDGAPSQEDGESSENMAGVRTAYTYKIQDESTATGWREIARDDLAKGYEYGRTAVYISEADEIITKLQTRQAYEIIGFIAQEKVERYMLLGTSNIVIANRAVDRAAIALSSLIHALYELDTVAVARFVQKDGKEPMLVLLSPHVDEELECLWENDLPFAEDLRTYRFPPVDKIFTVSGKTLTTHRNLPSEDLLSAMSDYVDQMSLISGEERFAIEDTYSPLYHTIEDAIKHRALHQGNDLPAKADVLMTPSQIPDDLKEQSQAALDRLIQAADVKKVPPKSKARARWRDRESEKPISGLDIDALLKKGKQGSGSDKKSVNIDPLNAIPEFKRLMDAPDDEALIQTGVKQMGRIIEEQVRTSFGDANYARAVEMLGVVRREMVDYEFSEYYNDLVRGLKKRLVAEELGGDRTEFWWVVRINGLGLIDESDVESSKISGEDARKFLSLQQP